MAKKRRSVYNNELTDEEKKRIQEYIESLSEDTDISNGVYFLDKENGYIYKFNTSLSQYADNRKD